MESKLIVKDGGIVSPGERLAEGMEFFPGPGTYRLGDVILANQVGVLKMDGKVLKTRPLASPYLPAKDDVVIGKIIDVLMSGWRVDINNAYSAVIPLKDATFDFIRKGDDLTEYFDIDDFVVCKITQVTSQNLLDVSMKGPGLRKLKGGQFQKVNSAKIPRIIGKHGSVIGLITHATGCQMVAGQNGLVWVSGEPESEVLAVRAIKRIEKQAHVPGLTDKIKTWLEKETGKTIDMTQVKHVDEFKSDRPPPRQGSFERRDGPPRRGPPRRGPPPRRDGRGPPRRDNRGPPRGNSRPPPRRDN